MKWRIAFKNYLPPLVLIVFLLWVIKIFDISYPLTLVSTTRSGEMAVVGEGKIEVIPDLAYVEVGITVNNVKMVEETQKKITAVNNKIIEGMKSLAIRREDITTSNYSIYPNYSYKNNVSSITGYNGNAQISIKVRKTEMVARVVTVATEAGANQIQGIQFTIEKPEKYREMAREKAIDNAKEQGQKLARNLGIKLGHITNIVESSSATDRPIVLPAKSLGGLGGAEEPSIEAGSQTITSTVTLYFEKR